MAASTINGKTIATVVRAAAVFTLMRLPSNAMYLLDYSGMLPTEPGSPTSPGASPAHVFWFQLTSSMIRRRSAPALVPSRAQLAEQGDDPPAIARPFQWLG